MKSKNTMNKEKLGRNNRKHTELKLSMPWGVVAAKVWDSNKENDKRILAIHGIMDNSGSFDRLIKLLPEDHCIICIDLPGHGYSSSFPEGVPLDFFAYVFSIHLILCTLKWNNCIYIGHSFGGQLGIYYSILYPGVITKLIMLDTLIPIPVRNENVIPHIRNILDSTMNALSNTDSRLYTKEDILYALTSMRSSSLNSEAANTLFERSVTKVGNLYKYNRDVRMKILIAPPINIEQHITNIKKISIPVMIIAANTTFSIYAETEIPHLLRKIESLHTNIKVVFVKGNHDVHNNNPERVAPYICKFLSDNIISKL